jgi:hypothetical protein
LGRAGQAFAPLEAEPSLPDRSRGGRASADEPPEGGRASAGDDFGAAVDSSPGLMGDLWGIAQVGADEQPGGSAVAGEGARPLLAEEAAHAPARDGLLAVEDAQEARKADLASGSPGDDGVAGAVVGTPPGRGGAAPCEVPREGRPGMDALDFLTNISLDSPPGLHARASPASGVHGSPDDWLAFKRGGGHGKEYVRPQVGGTPEERGWHGQQGRSAPPAQPRANARTPFDHAFFHRRVEVSGYCLLPRGHMDPNTVDSINAFRWTDGQAAARGLVPPLHPFEPSDDPSGGAPVLSMLVSRALDSRRVAPPTMQREALRLQAPAAEAAPARRRTRAHATRS